MTDKLDRDSIQFQQDEVCIYVPAEEGEGEGGEAEREDSEEWEMMVMELEWESSVFGDGAKGSRG